MLPVRQTGKIVACTFKGSTGNSGAKQQQREEREVCRNAISNPVWRCSAGLGYLERFRYAEVGVSLAKGIATLDERKHRSATWSWRDHGGMN